jgi:hypothetical protein
MAEESQELEAPEQEISPEANETDSELSPEANSEGESRKLTEIERVASQVGWIPADEYRGPKEKWRSAEDFLRAGAEISREFKTRMEAKDREFSERIRRSEKMAEVSLERQKRQIEEHYKAQMRYAASQGDMEVYNAVERNRDQALEQFEKEVAPIRQAPEPQGGLPPETVQFVERNASWFNRDPVMTGAAVALCGELQQRHPHLPLSSVMSMVEDGMRQEFPHRFNGSGNKQATPSGPSRVEGGQRPIRTSAKKGWDHLPPEAKAAGKKFIDKGIFGSDPAKAKQAYADDYWSLGD